MVSSVVIGTFAIFYLVVAAVLSAAHVTSLVILRILRRRIPFFFKKGVFWRVGLPTQFGRFFLSFGIMGLLSFKEQFGLTLQNVNESLLLVFSVGLPFAALFSGGAFMFIRKSQSGKTAGYLPSADWMKTSSDRIGTIVYTFTMNGLGEEMLYRGLIQGYLSMNLTGFILLGSFPLLYSTILASVIFILVHLYTMGETTAQFLLMLPYRIIVTLILGITFQLTGSLLAPIIIHNASNGFLVLAMIQATKNTN
ncbi:CPBP family intramembrane metalloprotease [Candidatus Bathyarchaeota archaeon]|nr:CPBP family intramembrane metalloprotease [Candidatus Bathyarchaeota archaeon]